MSVSRCHMELLPPLTYKRPARLLYVLFFFMLIFQSQGWHLKQSFVFQAACPLGLRSRCLALGSSHGQQGQVDYPTSCSQGLDQQRTSGQFRRQNLGLRLHTGTMVMRKPGLPGSWPSSWSHSPESPQAQVGCHVPRKPEDQPSPDGLSLLLRLFSIGQAASDSISLCFTFPSLKF